MAHALVCKQLLLILDPLAADAGLVATGEFNLGRKEDHRVPDLGLHREPSMGVWHETTALVVEVLSPHDETFEKLPFYAQHSVQEVVIVDPAARRVQWRALREDDYAPIERSALVELGAAELAALIEWPTNAPCR
jgi:Uma2 family endonuclease